jgi:phospholipase C
LVRGGGPAAQDSVGLLGHILDLNARHGAIMALEAPDRKHSAFTQERICRPVLRGETVGACETCGMLGGVERAAARRRIGAAATASDAVTGAAAGTESLPQIRHIVVLMMENHSYDNYLGMLTGRGDGFELGAAGQPVAANPDAAGTEVKAWHSEKTSQWPGVPTQSWNASHIQWDDGALDGFVRSIEQTVPGGNPVAPMRYWTEAELPFYYGLARTFPLATRWFCSCLGPTFPNRRFLISGTAHGLVDDLPFALVDYPKDGTIFDHLSAHGISWVNYHHVPAPTVWWRRLSHARQLGQLRLLLAGIGGAVRQAQPRLESKLQFTADMYPLDALRSVNHLRPVADFFAAAAAGTLPAVSIVDPDFSATSEENPQDIQAGEAFAASVVNAVLAGPGWPGTLLIWLYDEHGGYYDHVPPPAAPAPDDVPARGAYQKFPMLRLFKNTALGKKATAADTGPRTYTQLGFRVPAVIVSPYAKPGYVTELAYDHTAVLRLIQRKWSLPPLTKRDAAAADLLDALDLDGEPAFLTPPVLPEPAALGSKGRAVA